MEDGIVAELLKLAKDTLLGRLHELIRRIWKEESMSMEWKAAVLYPIYKNGDRSICNYRGIPLFNACYIFFALVIKERLNSYGNKELEETVKEILKRRRQTRYSL